MDAGKIQSGPWLTTGRFISLITFQVTDQSLSFSSQNEVRILWTLAVWSRWFRLWLGKQRFYWVVVTSWLERVKTRPGALLQTDSVNRQFPPGLLCGNCSPVTVNRQFTELLIEQLVKAKVKKGIDTGSCVWFVLGLCGWTCFQMFSQDSWWNDYFCIFQWGKSGLSTNQMFGGSMSLGKILNRYRFWVNVIWIHFLLENLNKQYHISIVDIEIMQLIHLIPSYWPSCQSHAPKSHERALPETTTTSDSTNKN